MPNRSPEELLRALEEAPTSAEEDEAARAAEAAFDAAYAEVSAMTPEARRATIAEAGIDADAMVAQTKAMLHAAAQREAENAGGNPHHPGAGQPAAQGGPRPAGRGVDRPVRGGGGNRGRVRKPRRNRRRRPKTPAVAPSDSAPSTPERPAMPESELASLRAKGVDACKAERWQACADLLNRANHADPAGPSKDPLVRLARRQAALALAGAENAARNGNAKQPEAPSSAHPAPSGPR